MILPDAAIGSIVAAGVAAGATAISLFIAKENKTSEFRQAWIDQLRVEIATVIAAMFTIQLKAIEKETARGQELQSYAETFAEYSRSVALVQLRLNADEELSQKVLDQLKSAEGQLYNAFDGKRDMDQMHRVRIELVTAARCLLKAEWERVKEGERAFRQTKIISACAAALVIALVLGHFLTG